MPDFKLVDDSETIVDPPTTTVNLNSEAGRIDIQVPGLEVKGQRHPAGVSIEYRQGYVLAHVYARKTGDESCVEPETFILKGPQTRAEVEALWDAFGDVPIDPDDPEEPIDEDFFIWKKGTPREEIWQWFDDEAYLRTRTGEKLTTPQLMGVAPKE